MVGGGEEMMISEILGFWAFCLRYGWWLDEGLRLEVWELGGREG